MGEDFSATAHLPTKKKKQTAHFRACEFLRLNLTEMITNVKNFNLGRFDLNSVNKCIKLKQCFLYFYAIEFDKLAKIQFPVSGGFTQNKKHD